MNLRDLDVAKRYERIINEPSDTHDHLPFFYELVTHIAQPYVIELGSRWGTSTTVFLHACIRAEGLLWSVDLEGTPPIPAHPRWRHLVGHDLDPVVLHQLPVRADVIFLDTSHDYTETLNELHAYVPKLRPGGTLLAHDTDVEVPDLVAEQEPFPVRRALDAFCAQTGHTWKNRDGSHGLGVLT